MKKVMVFTALIFLYIVNVYTQFHAVYIPEENLKEIKIDGDINDWTWVSKKYKVSTEQMKENVNLRQDYKVKSVNFF